MAITASYIDASTFNMIGDYKNNLPIGIAIRANCGTDGIKIVYVDKSEYKGGKTIVYLINSESDDLTANLVNIDISSVKPNTMQLTGNSGNIPVDWLWLYRGFRKGVTPTWINSDRIDITKGMIHYRYEGREILAIIESDISITGLNAASLSVDTWYYIYMLPPNDESCVINSSSFFIYNTTSPIFNSTYLQWVHPVEIQWKCIGFFYSLSAGSGVKQFYFGPKWFHFSTPRSWASVSRYQWSNWQYNMSAPYIPLTIPSDFRIIAQTMFWHYYGYNASVYWYYRPYGCTQNYSIASFHRHISPMASGSTYVMVPLDNNKLISFKTDVDFSASYIPVVYWTTESFKLPMGFIET